jgi:hypothetical protein
MGFWVLRFFNFYPKTQKHMEKPKNPEEIVGFLPSSGYKHEILSVPLERTGERTRLVVAG